MAAFDRAPDRQSGFPEDGRTPSHHNWNYNWATWLGPVGPDGDFRAISVWWTFLEARLVLWTKSGGNLFLDYYVTDREGEQLPFARDILKEVWAWLHD